MWLRILPSGHSMSLRCWLQVHNNLLWGLSLWRTYHGKMVSMVHRMEIIMAVMLQFMWYGIKSMNRFMFSNVYFNMSQWGMPGERPREVKVIGGTQRERKSKMYFSACETPSRLYLLKYCRLLFPIPYITVLVIHQAFLRDYM